MIEINSEANAITWHWAEPKNIWYESTSAGFTALSGQTHSRSFQDWFNNTQFQGLIIETLLEYVKSRPENFKSAKALNVSPTDARLTQYQAMAYILENTTIMPSVVTATAPFSNLPKFRRNQLVRRITGQVDPAEQQRLDLLAGENYLSADFRRINPLLAAFEAENFTPDMYRQLNFDFSARASQVLSAWQRIAAQRGYATSDTANSWNSEYLTATHGIFKQIMRVWNHFQQRPGTTTVYRGDARYLYASYPRLDPRAEAGNNYREGVNPVTGYTINWPGILSTTYGDPVTHNFINNKDIIWKLTLQTGHEGRILGSNNASEQELTFPPATKLRVDNLIVRNTNKSLRAAEFGRVASLIIEATVLAPVTSTSSQ